MKEGDKIIAYTKTALSSLESNLNRNGLKKGLSNILPIKGKVWSFVNENRLNILLDKKFEKYFIHFNLCFHKSDLIIVDKQLFKDEDFFI